MAYVLGGGQGLPSHACPAVACIVCVCGGVWSFPMASLCILPLSLLWAHSLVGPGGCSGSNPDRFAPGVGCGCARVGAGLSQGFLWERPTVGPDTCILPSSCSAPSQAASPLSLPSPLHSVTGRGMGCRSVPEAPPSPLGLRLARVRSGVGVSVCVWGLQRSLPPLSNARCCDFPPPPPPLHCRLGAGLAAVPSSLCGLPPPATSREGPAHSSMSEPQPGRAQRQGRRGGRAGAGLRHPGRVSSQVPPRAWRGGGRGAEGAQARPTESAGGGLAACPEALRGREAHAAPSCAVRPSVAAGGAEGARPEENQQPRLRVKPPQGAPASQAGGSQAARAALSEHGQSVRSGGARVRRPPALGKLGKAGLRGRGRRRSHVSAAGPLGSSGGRGALLQAAELRAGGRIGRGGWFGPARSKGPRALCASAPTPKSNCRWAPGRRRVPRPAPPREVGAPISYSPLENRI